MKYNQSLFLPVISAALAFFTANQATAAVYTATLTSQDVILGAKEAASTAVLGYTINSTSTDVGESGSNGTRINELMILGFTLPTFLLGETLESAQLTFNITDVRIGGGDELGDLDTYLLDSSDPSGTGTSLFYQSSTIQTAAGGINMEQIGRTSRPVGFDTASPQAVTYTLTGDSLALLQGFYTGNSPDQTEAFMRFNQTTLLTLGGGTDRYNIGSAELSLTTIPEPSAALLAGLGALALLRRRR